MSEDTGTGSDPTIEAEAFRQILHRETARIVANRLSELPSSGYRTWENLSREERSNITGWVELVFIAQIEAYGPALHLAGVQANVE